MDIVLSHFNATACRFFSGGSGFFGSRPTVQHWATLYSGTFVGEFF